MRLTRVLTAVVLSGAVLAAGVGGVASAAPTWPPPGSPELGVPVPGAVAAPAAKTAREALSSRLDAVLRGQSAGCYAGVRQADDGALVVSAVGGQNCVGAAVVASAQQAVAAEAPVWSLVAGAAPVVRVTNAQYSLAFLEVRRDSLTAKASQLRANGVTATNWGVDTQQNRLQVGLAQDTPAAEQAVRQATGGGSEISFTQSAGWRATDRIVDHYSWTGGDRIVLQGGGACTSGFSLIDSQSRTFNSTAGHCGYGVYTQGGNGYGKTINASWYEGGPTDAQVISTYPVAARGRIWSNLPGSTNGSFPVKGWILTSGQQGGNTVCTSATFSGDHCDAKINNNNQCIYFQNVNKTTCKLITAFSPSYRLIPGDSGGPVFNRGGITPDSGPNAYARGMFVGAYGGNPSVFAYTGIGEVQQQLGVAVLGG